MLRKRELLQTFEASTISWTSAEAVRGSAMPSFGEETKLVNGFGSGRPQLIQSFVPQQIMWEYPWNTCRVDILMKRHQFEDGQLPLSNSFASALLDFYSFAWSHRRRRLTAHPASSAPDDPSPFLSSSHLAQPYCFLQRRSFPSSPAS